MRQEESFGAIPLRKESGQWQVFLIQHRKRGYWGFPKGHAEPNELPFETACRELKEETHLDYVKLLHETPLTEQYSFPLKGERIFKKVLYFLMEVSGTVCLQKEEINDGVWMSFPEAMNQVTHPEGKAILKQVAQLLHVL
ncbi:MAG TPA: NUDIX domain-containing protein [Chlamydiales bacterium]|nr:NUDIX domain-containing protein [Chlamydiales bacterium]